MTKTKVAIIGSGNIGTDLLVKITNLSGVAEVAAIAGIDPRSEGLSLARRLGITATANGVSGLMQMPVFDEIRIVFDATSAAIHPRHNELLQKHNKKVIDLTPAAIGPYTVPPVKFEANLMASNVNMVSCGGQATIPIVAAISRVSPVHYCEIVASIASRSAGPGTRANIDEFTETTARALETIGGARRGKAIIVLNPAEPPLIMRDTIYCLCDEADEADIESSVRLMVSEVQTYVPGYRLKQAVQFDHFGHNSRIIIPEMGKAFAGLKVSVFLEVEGAAHYLPAFAGNLDIMTSAAMRTAERIIETNSWNLAS